MGFLVIIVELLCVMYRLYLTVIGIIIPLNCVIDKKILICLIYDKKISMEHFYDFLLLDYFCPQSKGLEFVLAFQFEYFTWLQQSSHSYKFLTYFLSLMLH